MQVKVKILDPKAVIPVKFHDDDFCYDLAAVSCTELAPGVYRYGFGIALQLKDEDDNSIVTGFTIRPRSSVWNTALTIVRMAQQTFGILFDKFDEQIHVNLRPLFAGADFRDVLFWWQRATDTLIKMCHPKEHINFNQSKDINLAYEIIARKLTDENIFNRASEQALKQNPDKWHLLDKEDRMRLKKGIPLS